MHSQQNGGDIGFVDFCNLELANDKKNVAKFDYDEFEFTDNQLTVCAETTGLPYQPNMTVYHKELNTYGKVVYYDHLKNVYTLKLKNLPGEETGSSK